MREPEPDTVRRARAGDEAAFEELVRGCQADVFRLATHLVRDRPTAEDVTQETFIRAYRSLGRFRDQARFSTWLFTITRNCAIDAIRRRERQRRTEHRAVEETPVPDSSLRVALAQAVDALPPQLREAFVLIEVFGLSYAEAAAVLGAPAGTLKSRMHRTRRLLMATLEERDADEM